jgi:hypothetical protein
MNDCMLSVYLWVDSFSLNVENVTVKQGGFLQRLLNALTLPWVDRHSSVILLKTWCRSLSGLLTARFILHLRQWEGKHSARSMEMSTNLQFTSVMDTIDTYLGEFGDDPLQRVLQDPSYPFDWSTARGPLVVGCSTNLGFFTLSCITCVSLSIGYWVNRELSSLCTDKMYLRAAMACHAKTYLTFDSPKLNIESRSTGHRRGMMQQYFSELTFIRPWVPDWRIV